MWPMGLLFILFCIKKIQIKVIIVHFDNKKTQTHTDLAVLIDINLRVASVGWTHAGDRDSNAGATELSRWNR